MAQAPGRLAGIASAFIDGVAVTAKGALKYKPSGTKREAITDSTGAFVGYSETGDPPSMSFTMIDTGGISVAGYFDGIGRQIVMVLANGKTVSGHSMTMMDPPEVSNDDATYETKWIGVSVVEAPTGG